DAGLCRTAGQRTNRGPDRGQAADGWRTKPDPGGTVAARAGCRTALYGDRRFPGGDGGLDRAPAAPVPRQLSICPAGFLRLRTDLAQGDPEAAGYVTTDKPKSLWDLIVSTPARLINWSKRGVREIAMTAIRTAWLLGFLALTACQPPAESEPVVAAPEPEPAVAAPAEPEPVQPPAVEPP